MTKGITSEAAVAAVGSRYDLILIGARRARELNSGWLPQVAEATGPVVTALREIEEHKVGRDYLLKNPNIDRREKPPHLRENQDK